MTSIRIGTRGSPLALRQTDIAIKKLESAGVKVTETIIITTTGDSIVDKPLYDIGGKALFAKELQQALIDKKIDVAVHSLKDMEWFSPDGLQLTAVLEREDPRDCFISNRHSSFFDLPPNSIVGTCAPRRISQIRYRLPSIITVPLRGNVQTRLAKLQEMEMDGIILAVAGMKRLGLVNKITNFFDTEFIIPAAGQGVIALETRVDDHQTNSILQSINHPETWNCIIAEKAVLAIIKGNCHTPIGVYAQQTNYGNLIMNAMLEIDGKVRFAKNEDSDSYNLAQKIARSLLK